MAQRSDRKVVPPGVEESYRVKFYLVKNGTMLKFEVNGGSVTVFLDYLRPVINGEQKDGFGLWRPDSPEWVAKKAGR